MRTETGTKKKKLSYQKQLQDKLSIKVKKILEDKNQLSNPVVMASKAWSKTSSQLHDVLGEDVFNQWFKDIRAIVIADNILILQAPSATTCHWINKHYQKLVDILLDLHCKDLSSFFISTKDHHTNQKPQIVGKRSKEKITELL